MFAKSWHERERQAAQQRYNEAVSAYEDAEQTRVKRLRDRQAAHQAEQDREAQAARQPNADLEQRRRQFAEAQVETVVWFIEKALAASPYPAPLKPTFTVNDFRPDDLELRLEIDLPDTDVIPAIREYRYVKSKDVVHPVPRPQAECKKQYAHVIAAVVLRAAHEVFASTPGNVVKTILVNGRVTTIDRSTGHRERPHLLSLTAARTSCTCPQVNSNSSSNSYSSRWAQKRGTRSRRKTAASTPSPPAKHVFVGGVCLIQAKRWKGLVGLDAVHALTGVMTDHNAHTGALVTTSWFGRASEEFAERNRIRLIDGAQLKHLFQEYLNRDVIPGTTPPRKRTGGRSTP